MKKLFYLVLFGLLSALPAHSQTALVQTAICAGTTASFPCVAFGSSVTSGNTIIVIVWMTAGALPTPPTLTGNGNTYTNKVNTYLGNQAFLVYEADSVASGSTTITIASGTTSNIEGAAYEYSGLASSAFDKTVMATGSTQAISSGATATTTSANELVIGAAINQAPFTGMTNGYKQELNTGVNFYGVTGDLTQVVLQAAPAFAPTQASAHLWYSGVATFAWANQTPQVQTPVASPVAGNYTGSQLVTFTDPTAGATICYRKDGGVPTATSAGTCDSNGGLEFTYSGAIAVSTPMTIKALGTKAASGNSPPFAGIYNIPFTPTLPLATVSLTLPTQGSSACPTLTTGTNCKRSPASGSATDFQNAINASTCGDTIILVAGSTYSGNFTIPSTVCSGWIEITSSAAGSLPAAGTRVGAGDVSNMPVISTPNASPALAFQPSSNHWRIIGAKITTSYTATPVFWLVGMGFLANNSTGITVQGNLPDQIIIDRSYIIGTLSTAISHGIFANTQSFALVDSFCDVIGGNGIEAQCVESYNGIGPFLIQNNFLGASTENIMFGGADPAITNLIPSDITIVGNLIQKDAAWRGNGWVFKNIVELKNAQRVLLDGNVISTTWFNGQQEAVIIRSVNQSGGCNWCAVRHVTVTHNLIEHAPEGIVLAALQGPNVALPTNNVLIRNNVFTDISDANWSGNSSTGFVFQFGADDPPDMFNIAIDHNTAFSDRLAMQVNYENPGDTMSYVQYTNNLQDAGTVGGIQTQAGGPISGFLNGYNWQDVIFLNPGGSGSQFPGAPVTYDTIAGAAFTSVSGSDPEISGVPGTGNLQLTGGSAYHNAGTDGNDIGVWDWTCYNAEIAAALAGTYSAATYCGPSGIGSAISPGIKITPGVSIHQ